MGSQKKVLDWTDFRADFVKFFLNPTGCQLSVQELGKGVYALLSSIPNVDNVGFVVGERGVLVIDSHISLPMARQIQERVCEVTPKPMRGRRKGTCGRGRCGICGFVLASAHAPWTPPRRPGGPPPHDGPGLGVPRDLPRGPGPR